MQLGKKIENDSQPITNLPDLGVLLQEIEDDLYTAIEGFEQGDLTIVRQCAARVQSNTVFAWQIQRRQKQQYESQQSDIPYTNCAQTDRK